MKKYRVTRQVSRGYNKKTWDGAYGFNAIIDNLDGAKKSFQEELLAASCYLEWRVSLQERSWMLGRWRTIDSKEQMDNS